MIGGPHIYLCSVERGMGFEPTATDLTIDTEHSHFEEVTFHHVAVGAAMCTRRALGGMC